MRFGVYVVSPPGYVHARAFDEVRDALVHALRELGHDAIVCDVPTADRQLIVLGTNLLQRHPVELPHDAVLYNLEQVERGSVWMTDEALAPLRRHRVWDYSARNVSAFKQLGIDAEHVPIGYAANLERIAPLHDKDIDVLFYGSLNERRIVVLDTLEARGAKVVDLFGQYGEARDAHIARAKVVLNLHHYDAQILEEVRLFHLLANRVFVVSEGGDPAAELPYAGGVVFAPYERLVDVVFSALSQPAARARVALEGQRLMRARPYAEFLRQPVARLLSQVA